MDMPTGPKYPKIPGMDYDDNDYGSDHEESFDYEPSGAGYGTLVTALIIIICFLIFG